MTTAVGRLRREKRHATGIAQCRVGRCRPKKHLGQHFLTAPYYAGRIASAIPASASDNILEIGPGRGALSVCLKEKFPRFHAVEIDPDASSVLRQRLGGGGWTLHVEDALAFDFSRVGFPLHVVGNLPYSTAAQIIHKTLRYGSDILSCTFMVQREVAERICARTHSRAAGYLTVFCGFYGAPRILFHVPPGAFFPKPNVDSSVFQLRVEQDLDAKLPPGERAGFFSFVDSAFRMRRKKLYNALGRAWEPEMFSRTAVEAGVDPDARPEDLDAAQWLSLYRRLATR